MVKCELCGKSGLKMLNVHLTKVHQMTVAEYADSFPGASLGRLSACEHCGSKTTRRKFCSSSCRTSWHSVRLTEANVARDDVDSVECQLCHRQFRLITNSHLKKSHGVTPEEYLTQFPGARLYSAEMGQRYQETRFRVEKPECQYPECSNLVTQSHNKHCSYSCASKHLHMLNPDRQRGLNNPQATDGMHSLEKAQKRAARERDQHLCRRCGKAVRGKSAHVHHKIPKQMFEDLERAHRLDNLVTVCPPCHKTIEWALIRELYRRALKLDELAQNHSDHVSLPQFVENQFTGGGY
jgi:5-methylcytosine-specific restriction endonuclease McrA/predicted transcriptional regulator